MTSTTVAPSQQLNGVSAVPPELLREADFLDKLLQIRDAVFASKHPRIHLPPNVLEHVAPRPTQQPTPPSASRPTTNGTPTSHQPLQLFPPRSESSLQQSQAPNEYSSPAHAAPRSFSAKSASSGIDPVLLTKSDHLIRAELQLKRQQIERAIKDQFDRKGRANDTSVEDRETHFDVEDVLIKAQALVEPVSGLQSTANNSESSESFDENSYYSSQANSWSSEEINSNQTAHGADIAEPLTPQANRSAFDAQLTAAKLASHPEPATKRVEPAVIDLDEEPYEPADDIEIYEPEPAKVPEEDEDEDYSPPPADVVGPSGPNRGRQRDRGNEGHSGMNGSSRRQSPAGHPPQLHNPRKRRREEKRGEKRRQQANKRVIRSPEPLIKEEPQSPPPFASYPDSQPSKRRALQPLPNDVEVVPAREGRMQPVYYRDQDNSPRALRQYEEPLSPTVIRVPQRRLERDDQDLRRVASLQYARRPHSPGAFESYPASEMRQVRAASHAFVERPMETVYREASVRASAAPRYVLERSRSPVHEYLPRAQSPVMMAPPPRRIVVDEYGNKYYAAPVDTRESVAPPGRRMEAEPYYERAITREPTMRAPARSVIYEDDNMQRMPPPPPRRYVEPLDVEAIEARSYRQRETSHRPMEVEYAAREPIERRAVVQYEDLGPPREYIPSRAYSVRPEVIRREAPSEYAPVRHESVQPRYVSVAAPRYREASVVHQEPYDDRRYTAAPVPQGRRYLEEGAIERPVEVVQEPYAGETRRVSSYRF